jgi:hypothetical protein
MWLQVQRGDFSNQVINWRNWVSKEMGFDLPMVLQRHYKLLVCTLLSIWKPSGSWLDSRHPKVKLMDTTMRGGELMGNVKNEACSVFPGSLLLEEHLLLRPN